MSDFDLLDIPGHMMEIIILKSRRDALKKTIKFYKDDISKRGFLSKIFSPEVAGYRRGINDMGKELISVIGEMEDIARTVRNGIGGESNE